jgi:hypothetical protein
MTPAPSISNIFQRSVRNAVFCGETTPADWGRANFSDLRFCKNRATVRLSLASHISASVLNVLLVGDDFKIRQRGICSVPVDVVQFKSLWSRTNKGISDKVMHESVFAAKANMRIPARICAGPKDATNASGLSRRDALDATEIGD